MAPDNWNEWSKYVLKELERLSDAYEEMSKELSSVRVDEAKALGGIRTEIATLKLRAGLWGAVGAAIPTIATVLLLLLLK